MLVQHAVTSGLALTCKIEATYGDHQVEVGPVETSTGQPGQSEHQAGQEGDVDCCGEGAAAAGLLCEDVDHLGVGWSSGVITLALVVVSCSWYTVKCVGVCQPPASLATINNHSHTSDIISLSPINLIIASLSTSTLS